jgi:hypothetical protein
LWQDSICDWAERCQASTRRVCDDQFQGVTCKADEIASKCADAIDGADCDGIPPLCGPDEIADPAPAVHACELIFTRFCDRAVECGAITSRQACLAVEKPDCSGAFSYGLDHEACLEEIDRVECEVLVRPAICARVIVSRAQM